MRTRRYQDLMRALEQVFSRSQIEQMGIDILNAAVGRLWHIFPWRQSIGVIPPFYVVAGVNEYPDVISNMPTDVSSLISAWFEDRSGNSPVRFPMLVARDVERAVLYGRPAVICRRELWRPNQDFPAASYIVFPTPAPGLGPPHHVISGTYKRCQPIIDAAGLSMLLPFDDAYFADLVAVARLVGWEFVGDPRARDAMAILGPVYSSIAAREGFELGNQNIVPYGPLTSLDLR